METLKLFDFKSFSNGFSEKNVNVITNMSLGKEKNIKFIREKKYDHIVIDEAHHAQSKSYIKLIENICYPCKILGLTAEVYRELKQKFPDFDWKKYENKE